MKKNDVNMIKVKIFPDKDTPGQEEERRQPVINSDVILMCCIEVARKTKIGQRKNLGLEKNLMINTNVTSKFKCSTRALYFTRNM